MKASALACLISLAISPCVRAEDAPPDKAEIIAKIQQLADSLKYQDGEVTLRGGLAKLTLPPDFRYLGPDDSATVLERIWGNPHAGKKSLGMLVPAKVSVASPGGWAVVISYEEDGCVKDDDAGKINYDDLLQQMRKGVAAENEERVKEGFPRVELIGWAAPPRYDSAEKKMYWAKEIGFGDSEEHTLNYNIRVLGRRGVLVLNAVSAMSQLHDIEALSPTLLAAVNFQDGNRYADFKPGTDKVATYGLAALVAGGVLAKAGGFKVIIAAILAAKKFVIIGLVAISGFIKKLFGGKSRPPEQ